MIDGSQPLRTLFNDDFARPLVFELDYAKVTYYGISRSGDWMQVKQVPYTRFFEHPSDGIVEQVRTKLRQEWGNIVDTVELKTLMSPEGGQEHLEYDQTLTSYMVHVDFDKVEVTYQGTRRNGEKWTLKTEVMTPAEADQRKESLPTTLYGDLKDRLQEEWRKLMGCLGIELKTEQVGDDDTTGTLTKRVIDVEWDLQCAICFESVKPESVANSQLPVNAPLTKEEEALGQTPCGHVFHRDCIRQWIFSDVR